MGYEILYCAGCQAQLRGPDFDAGTAFRHQGAAYCEACAPESVESAAVRTPDTASVRQTPPTTRLHARTSDTRRTTRARRKKSRTPAVLAVSAAAAVVAGGVLLALAGSGSRAPAPAGTPPELSRSTDAPAPPPPPKRKEESSREKEAEIELEKLLARAGDRRTRLARLRDFTDRYAGTFAAAKARAKMKELDPPAASPPRDRALLNGTDLAGWRTIDGEPRYEDGALRVRGNDETMIPLEAPDFELTGRLRLALTKGSAGIGFRRPGQRRGVGNRMTLYADGDVHYRYKVNSSEIAARAKSGTLRMNHWHAFRLTVRGESAVLEVDGREILRAKAIGKNPGHLAVYGNHLGDGEEAAFKDLRVRP